MIYKSLPAKFRKSVIDTKIISGHADLEEIENYVTTDKLYLLSFHEIYIDNNFSYNIKLEYLDFTYYNTRQLDFYKENICDSKESSF